MPKYVIERNFPGAGDLSTQDLQQIAEKSCDILQEMGPDIQWVESYVATDKVYCVYIANNEGLVREHASKGDFPVDNIKEVKTVIDPTTSEK